MNGYRYPDGWSELGLSEEQCVSYGYTIKLPDAYSLEGFEDGKGPQIITSLQNTCVSFYELHNINDFSYYTHTVFDDGECAYASGAVYSPTVNQLYFQMRASHYPFTFIDLSKFNIDYGTSELFGKGFTLNTGSGIEKLKMAFYFTNTSDVVINKTSDGVIQVFIGTNGINDGHELSENILIALKNSSIITGQNKIGFGVTTFTEYDNYITSLGVHPNGFVFWNIEHYGTSDSIVGKIYAVTTKIEAEYHGPRKFLGENYDINDVTVKVYKEVPDYSAFGTLELTLNNNEFTVDSTLITKIPAIFNAFYDGCSDDFLVPAREKIIRTEAIYIGKPIRINTKPNPIEIIVTEYYNNGTIHSKLCTIWEFYGEDTVTANNQGVLPILPTEIILYQDYTLQEVIDENLICNVTVPYYIPYPTRIEAHYHGKPVLINTKYKKENVHVMAHYSDGEMLEIPPTEWTVDGLIIRKIGNENHYLVTWHGFYDGITVRGYRLTKLKLNEFLIYKIYNYDKKEEQYEENVTHIYKDKFMVDLENNLTNINLVNLDRYLLPGDYRVFVPKKTLVVKYPSEWIINKTNKGTQVSLERYLMEEE